MAERVRPNDEVVQANIKKWNIPQPDREYTVLIHCSTYNHGNYIKDALEGFVMQKCSFSFCAIIIDDCSTDNNAEIIKEYAEKYPDIIKPILLGENHMQHGILRDPYFEKWHQSAKYIAQCEGDDYWIDPLKLQKQVSFLESHPDYALSYTRFNILNQKTSELTMGPDTPYIDFKHQLIQNYIGTLTTIIVAEVYRRYYEEINPAQYKWPMGDFPLWLYVAANHNIHYLPDITSVYRMHQGSASRPTDFKKKKTFLEGHLAVQHFFAEKYNMPKEVTNAIDYKTNYKLVLAHIQYKQYRGIYPYLCRLTVKDVCKCFIHMVLGFVK